MRFLADENVDRPIVDRLRADGHTVLWVVQTGKGALDEAVISLANEEHAILITADTDFGGMVFRQGRFLLGVVLIRLAGLSPERKARLVAAAVREHSEQLIGHFAVVGPGAVRIRRHLF